MAGRKYDVGGLIQQGPRINDAATPSPSDENLAAAISLRDLDIVGAFESLGVLHPLLTHDSRI